MKVVKFLFGHLVSAAVGAILWSNKDRITSGVQAGYDKAKGAINKATDDEAPATEDASK